MKKVIYFLSIIVIGSSLSSCFSISDESPIDKILAPVVEYNVIEIEELYSMKVPKFMTPTTILNEDASMQYNNPFKEKYVTVLDEDKEGIVSLMQDYGVFDESKSNLENYVHAKLSFLAESGISILNQSELKSKTINGRKAYSTIVEGSVPDLSVDIAYFFTYLEGKDHFYMITSWTLLNRKDTYIEEVEEMTRSFREF